jgi:hypothetical protein
MHIIFFSNSSGVWSQQRLLLMEEMGFQAGEAVIALKKDTATNSTGQVLS